MIVGGGTVNLMGTTTWSGNTGANNNAIQFWNGATVNNHGTFNDANAFASFIEHSVGGPHNFNNIGTYNKQSNTITTTDLGLAFNNSGVVNVNAGTLRPSGGTSTGTFNIAAGATLDFKNGNNTLNGATTQGLGTLAISSDLVGADAVVSINGGTHTTPFALSGSVLTGSSHTFQGAVTWTGGSISGAGTTDFSNDVAITRRRTRSPSSSAACSTSTARPPGAATPPPTTTRSSSGTGRRSTTSAPSTTPTPSPRSSSTTSAARTSSTTRAPTTSWPTP